MRSVTEEDVNFTRRRVTSAHFVPPPDYPIDEPSDTITSSRPPLGGPHWASGLPDPQRYEIPPVDYAPITPAFATTRRRPRQRVDPDTPSSSVFGPRRLADPYHPLTAASPSMRRRFLEYGVRPYSPDIDALSLEPSTTLRSQQTYMQSYASAGSQQQTRQSQFRASATTDEKEEIKSTTETDVYDWNRYS